MLAGIMGMIPITGVGESVSLLFLFYASKFSVFIRIFRCLASYTIISLLCLDVCFCSVYGPSLFEPIHVPAPDIVKPVKYL